MSPTDQDIPVGQVNEDHVLPQVAVERRRVEVDPEPDTARRVVAEEQVRLRPVGFGLFRGGRILVVGGQEMGADPIAEAHGTLPALAKISTVPADPSTRTSSPVRRISVPCWV